MQAMATSTFAVLLTVLVKWALTFTGENAAATIADEMPENYLLYFSALSIALLVNSLLAFAASYFEIAWAQKLSIFSSLLTTVAAIVLVVVTKSIQLLSCQGWLLVKAPRLSKAANNASLSSHS